MNGSRIDELKERMRGLRTDELKALLAVMIAGLFVLLSVQALELFAIRRSLEQIKHELRPLTSQGSVHTWDGRNAPKKPTNTLTVAQEYRR
jgi:hypothetical protein